MADIEIRMLGKFEILMDSTSSCKRAKRGPTKT